jgi:diguanylate cyclase (GGDEF)-like protein
MDLDHLISIKLASNFETLYRARVLCFILLAALLAFVVSSVYFFIFAELSHSSRNFAGFSTLLLASAMALGMLNLHFFGHLVFNSYFLVVILFSSISLSILLTGGIELSPIFPLLVVPILIAYVLLGNKPGLVVGLLTVAAYWIATWIGEQAIQLPLYMDMNYRMVHLHANWMVTFVMLIAIMSSTDRMYHSLRLQRDEERVRYEYLAAHDSLTGLYNRMMFDDLLDKAINRSIRNGCEVALLYIDLDKFKPINDDLGHRVGDFVLQEMAARLLEVVRLSDTVARIGGDEFAVIVDGDNLSSEHLSVFAERVCSALVQPITYSGESIQVGCSIGIARYPENGSSSEQLLKAADEAMYSAKKSETTFLVA